MAFQLGTPGGRRARRGGDFAAPMSEINVTPFVDVMLVLLVIFMVAAPMLTVSIPVDLPSGASGTPTPSEPITVSVDARGRIFVQDIEVNEKTLIAKIDELAKEGLQQRIFIRGDEGVVYGRMVAVLAALTGRGYNKIGIVSIRPRTQQ